MHFIAHRINTIKELKRLPVEYGVEIDLRDRGDKLVLQHEPFRDGEDFEGYLRNYRHGTMILNIKSERIEFKVLELIKKYNVKDYFFLDSSFPMIYSLSENKENNIAVRFSEFEGLDSILSVKDRVKWVWVDCFTSLPINKDIYGILKEHKLRLCLVSPELLGREKDIQIYREYLASEGIIFDAICTKFHNIVKWSS